jgi:hypothetical protein
MFVVKQSDMFTISYQCAPLEGQNACPPQPQHARDAVMISGFTIIAAGAALPVLALIESIKKGKLTEVSK